MVNVKFNFYIVQKTEIVNLRKVMDFLNGLV